MKGGEELVVTVILHLTLAKALSWHAVTVFCPKGCSTWGLEYTGVYVIHF